MDGKVVVVFGGLSGKSFSIFATFARFKAKGL